MGGQRELGSAPVRPLCGKGKQIRNRYMLALWSIIGLKKKMVLPLSCLPQLGPRGLPTIVGKLCLTAFSTIVLTTSLVPSRHSAFAWLHAPEGVDNMLPYSFHC